MTPMHSIQCPPTHALIAAGGQLFDLICLVILVSATISLRAIPPGFIYYWLKVRGSSTQEVGGNRV